MTTQHRAIRGTKLILIVSALWLGVLGADVRFQFVDGAKAQALLQEANNFPTLFIADRARTLSVDEETKKQAITFVDGGHLFLMYSNAGTVVKPGTPVTIVFGTIQLEPINAK